VDKEVTKYLGSVPKERKELVDKLHRLITSLYPEAEIDMKYKMPTYHAGGGWVAVANQKNYVSLYTCGYHHIAPFKEKHPKIKTGKGCINFKVSDLVPLKDIELVVKHAIEHPKEL